MKNQVVEKCTNLLNVNNKRKKTHTQGTTVLIFRVFAPDASLMLPCISSNNPPAFIIVLRFGYAFLIIHFYSSIDSNSCESDGRFYTRDLPIFTDAHVIRQTMGLV